VIIISQCTIVNYSSQIELFNEFLDYIMSTEAGERQIETNALERCVNVILFSPKHTAGISCEITQNSYAIVIY
jgi:hypothetical protein